VFQDARNENASGIFLECGDVGEKEVHHNRAVPDIRRKCFLDQTRVQSSSDSFPSAVSPVREGDRGDCMSAYLCCVTILNREKSHAFRMETCSA
jgi:hypothetical protein